MFDQSFDEHRDSDYKGLEKILRIHRGREKRERLKRTGETTVTVIPTKLIRNLLKSL